jgi:thiol-disulfide isomerase/thioredoxin
MKKYLTYIKQTILILIIYIFQINTTTAQSVSNKIQPVKIGEKVPDFVFTKILQYSQPTAKISDFKGKALILDFWSIGCHVCIAAFPKMHELQEKFADRITILPVSFYNPGKDIDKFIAKRKGTKFALKLPTVVQEPRVDTTLRQLFPFYGMPHEIWIDKDGIFRAQTDHYFVNEDIINKFLKGEPINWVMKITDLSAFDKETFSESKEPNKLSVLYKFKSILSGYQEGKSVPPSYNKDSLIRITMPNQSILALINYSLGGAVNYVSGSTYNLDEPFSSDVFQKRQSLEVRNPAKYLRSPTSENDTLFARWAKENTYCYELILPKEFSWNEAFDFMKQDIQRFFKIKIEVKSLPVSYLALKKIGTEMNPVATKGGNAVYDEMDDGSSVTIRNMTIELITSFIEGAHTPIILNETGITTNVDMILHKEKKFSLSNYNDQLKKYGLCLVEKTKEMSILMVKEL